MHIMQFDGLVPLEFDAETDDITTVTQAQIYIDIHQISSFHEIVVNGGNVCTMITMTNLDEILVEYSAQDFFTELQLATQEIDL